MIGKKIAEVRKQRGYTLSELAEKSNISKSYLSNIERDLNINPSLQVMIRISNVLKIDLLTLLKAGTDHDSQLIVEKELDDLVNELKEIGMEKEHIKKYKTLIEFIKWDHEKSKHEQ